MKTCPFCAEEIQDAAIVCKHCRRDLNGIVAPSPAPGVMKVRQADWVSTAAKLGAGIFVALFALAAFGPLFQGTRSDGPASSTEDRTPPAPTVQEWRSAASKRDSSARRLPTNPRTPRNGTYEKTAYRVFERSSNVLVAEFQVPLQGGDRIAIDAARTLAAALFGATGTDTKAEILTRNADKNTNQRTTVVEVNSGGKRYLARTVTTKPGVIEEMWVWPG